MTNSKEKEVNDSLEFLIAGAIPRDHFKQVTLNKIVIGKIIQSKGQIKILDLGCGDGRALKIFDRYAYKVEYRGVDITISPEVYSRSINDPRFDTFDGINLPYGAEDFEIVYSKQVFEHVRHPDALMKEVYRVLRKDGCFVGSVSFLEPYHSYIIFNHSPYGIWSLLSDIGFKNILLRPGIDGLSLIFRNVFKGQSKRFRSFFVNESPLNMFLNWRARRKNWSVQRANAAKLAIAGQIIFYAEK